MSVSLSLTPFSVMGYSPASMPAMFTLMVAISPDVPVKVSSYCEPQRKRMAPSPCSATVSVCSSSSASRPLLSDTRYLPFDDFTAVIPSGRYKSNWKPRICAVLFMQMESVISLPSTLGSTVAGAT